MNKYKATEGAQFDKKKAQIYGKCLEEIEERHGKLKARDVVDEARSKKNPLHEVFDWDNTSAAEKYRLEQARHLINHLTVEVSYDGQKEDIKGWVSVNETPGDKKMNKVYIKTERVLSEPELRHQIVVGAIEEAEYWHEKWKQYKELSEVFTVIKKTKGRLKKKKRGKKK
jgi:hypothetical protein